MFPDAMYYVTLQHGNSPMACIVRNMDTFEFFQEYRNRFSRYPYIMSLVPLDEDEFYQFLDVFDMDNSDAIFDNGEYDGD